MFYFLSILSIFFLSPTSSSCISAEEKALANLINEYRISKNLQAVPLSAKLSKVARVHALDLVENYTFNPSNRCNPHSWSDNGKWTPCCYTNDHKQAACMWDKPKEIAGYEELGYEIVFYNSMNVEPKKALEGWKKSQGHNMVLVNKGPFQQADWNAMGVAIYKTYAIVWFGQAKDTDTVVNCE